MLTELLGFVPQLLLDDIADAATDTVNNAIEGLEDYLRTWIASRDEQPPSEDLDAEVENGLLEFHTLLCGHRDMCIDMLETWSMRNVFYVPPELKIVMPHQKDLDLGTGHGQDVKVQVELEVLRRKIEHVSWSVVVVAYVGR
jgi:kinetochore protein Mis12/MTW1